MSIIPYIVKEWNRFSYILWFCGGVGVFSGLYIGFERIQVVAFSVEPELAFSTGPSVAIFAEPEHSIAKRIKPAPLTEE